MFGSTIQVETLRDFEAEPGDVEEAPTNVQAADVRVVADPGLRVRIARRIRRGAAVVAGVGVGAASLVASASAAVNWTEIQEIITGAASIFPAFGEMITQVVGPLMMLGICGMVLYFFDAFVEAFKNAFAFIGRR